MENRVDVGMDTDLVEKGGEVGTRNDDGEDERVVIGGLEEVRGDVDDEVFEEAREQLPQVKAVTGDVNEEEVYVTPVVDSIARYEVEGGSFEDSVEIPGVGVNGGEEQVQEEDVESVEDIQSGIPIGGKTYAQVLVEKLDHASSQDDNVNETVDVDNVGKTESLRQADASVDKSGIHEVEGKETFEVGEPGLRGSESTYSNGMESTHVVSGLEDQTNGVLSLEDDDHEDLMNLKVGHTETISTEVNSEYIDDMDQESSGLATLREDQEDVESDVRMVSASTESGEVLMMKMPEPDTTHVDEKASICDSDNFKNTEVHTKEVDSRSLPHVEDGNAVASEVSLGEGSVIGADQTVDFGEVANIKEAVDVVLEHQDAPEEQPAGHTTPEDGSVEQPALVTDSSPDKPANGEIQGVTHTVSDRNQAGSEVLDLKSVTEKESKQQKKELERPESVPASSSDRSVNSPSLPVRPAGLGRAAPLLEPAPRVVQQPRVNGSASQAQAQLVDEAANGENEEIDETREKLQMIRVKFLRLAHRLGQTPHNVVVAQVLYRLGLAEQLRGRNGGRVGAFSFDRASAMAEQLEAVGQEPLDFSCTIMILGKTGVGKSATINSIFDEVKFGTDAFHYGTKKVQDVVGTVQGIKVRVIDTPGLLTSWSDQSQNEKILQSVKRFIKKSPPDIVLYLDRLDMQSREFGDMPLLRTITKVFGPSLWFNAIVVLTHAGSAPPDGPNGTASSYDTFVTQRSHVVQHAVRQAAGDMRLMNPVSLVENHSACRTNRAGQRVLPNGQVWKPHLLLLSFASKILAEANNLLKLQDGPPGKPFANRSRALPLPYLLSSMLQSKPHLRLPEEQMGGDDSLDDDLDVSSDSDGDSEYDELPPFKPLTKAQLSNLSKAQRKDYFDELEYREKLLMKKQLKEERLQRKMLKKMAAAAKDIPKDYSENVEEENGGAASMPVPMPDLALPASFDSDNPTHRYRYLDSSNPWLVRPVLETQGWDHDVGYEGVNVERSFVLKEKVPFSCSGQITKDKKDANVQMEVAGTLKHGEGKATSVSLDLQTVGKDIAYTLRNETTFCNIIRNKLTAGMSFTLLGDAISAGMKLEDKLIATKRFRMVITGGAMTNRGDIAYGGSLEATLRDKDHPIGRSLSTLGLSIMDWHGDLAIGCNIQSQIPMGRYSNIIARANLNNKGSGQVSIRLNSSEQIQIALIAILPLLRKVFSYSQESLQY